MVNRVARCGVGMCRSRSSCEKVRSAIRFITFPSSLLRSILGPYFSLSSFSRHAPRASTPTSRSAFRLDDFYGVWVFSCEGWGLVVEVVFGFLESAVEFGPSTSLGEKVDQVLACGWSSSLSVSCSTRRVPKFSFFWGRVPAGQIRLSVVYFAPTNLP